MVLSVENGDGIDVLEGDNIMHVLVEEFVYDAPLIFKLGINDTTMSEEFLTQGEAYKLTTMYGNQVDVILADIMPFSQLQHGSGITDYVFMEEESYKLKHNLFPPDATVWGVSLRRYIIGGRNQLEIAIIELRKMGLSLAITKDLVIVQKHVLEYLEGEPRYIQNILKVKTHKTVSQRNNYAMITNGETSITITGSDSAIHIPMMRDEHVKAFDLKIEAKYIIFSNDSNFDLLLGSTVFFKQRPFSLMERQVFYSKDGVSSVFTLGYTPVEEVNT